MVGAGGFGLIKQKPNAKNGVILSVNEKSQIWYVKYLRFALDLLMQMAFKLYC